MSNHIIQQINIITYEPFPSKFFICFNYISLKFLLYNRILIQYLIFACKSKQKLRFRFPVNVFTDFMCRWRRCRVINSGLYMFANGLSGLNVCRVEKFQLS